ncbi:hypothetical protein C8J57DRAFT_1514208 [Mycena rebaudengoi]|nr:hypothetical protein C8J57DRAFT_1514208 [Mycena rebaudengoi]
MDMGNPSQPSLFAKCTYSLTISITKDRRLGFLSKTQLSNVGHHRPQSSDFPGYWNTPVSVLPFFSKNHAGGMVLDFFRDEPRSSSNLSPIQCQVSINPLRLQHVVAHELLAFIPSVKIFGLSDIIPFHPQVSGPLSSLRELVLPTSPTPPGSDRGPVHSCSSCMETCDWDGEVKCDASVTVGGFQAAELTVKVRRTACITLEMMLPKAVLSPLHLVTKTFVTPT